MKLEIKTNFADVQRQLDSLQREVRDRAMASAMNKTLDLARTQMTRQIAGEFNVTAGYVRDRLRVRRASARGAGVVHLYASLIGGKAGGRRRSANIIAFVEKSVSLAQGRKRAKAGTLRQVHVKIKRKGGVKPLGDLRFIGNKGRTVFERIPERKMASRAGKLNKHTQAIGPVQTIDVAQMFNTRRINRAVVAMIRERFPQIFEHEAKFFVDRFNRAGG